jgi:hypothetical protein
MNFALKKKRSSLLFSNLFQLTFSVVVAKIGSRIEFSGSTSQMRQSVKVEVTILREIVESSEDSFFFEARAKNAKLLVFGFQTFSPRLLIHYYYYYL